MNLIIRIYQCAVSAQHLIWLISISNIQLPPAQRHPKDKRKDKLKIFYMRILYTACYFFSYVISLHRMWCTNLTWMRNRVNPELGFFVGAGFFFVKIIITWNVNSFLKHQLHRLKKKIIRGSSSKLIWAFDLQFFGIRYVFRETAKYEQNARILHAEETVHWFLYKAI